MQRFLPEPGPIEAKSLLEANSEAKSLLEMNHASKVDHVSNHADASASNKSCPCTWSPTYPCSLQGSCYTYSTKGTCENAGGQFCGDSSATTCPCTWSDAYPCSLSGSCYNVMIKSSCEGYGGQFCGDAPAPAPPPPPPPPSPPAPPSPSGGGSVPANMQSVLDQHNTYRATHHAPPLSWDAGLASQAESWANGCKFEHSTMGNGENLYANSGSSFDGASAVTSWYNELYDPGYDFNNPGFSSGAGHFTQVVWKGSTTVGCYMKVCYDLFPGWGNSNLLVCEYSPPGNYMGQFSANVLPA